MRLRALSAAVAVLVLVAGIAAAQPLPSAGELVNQSPKDKYNLAPTRCPGAGNASGPVAYDDTKRQWVCAATPTPGSGGASEVCVTCTRSSATAYTCTGLSSITKLLVDNTAQTIGAATLNGASISGTTATFGYSIDNACAGTCEVRACGS